MQRRVQKRTLEVRREVRKIFEGGIQNYEEIAKELEKRGFVSPKTKKPYSYSNISHLLNLRPSRRSNKPSNETNCAKKLDAVKSILRLHELSDGEKVAHVELLLGV